MANISCFPQDYKVSRTMYYRITSQEYSNFKHAGMVVKKFNTYRLILNFREIFIECPVIVKDNYPSIVVFPAFKLPYRPYPCFVYFYAVALFLSGISMRKAAASTAKRFGILNFSHSTISRAFSKMDGNFPMLLSLIPFDTDVINLISNMSLPGRPKSSVYPRLSYLKKAVAPMLFELLSPILDIPSGSSLMVYEHFMRFCCLLI